MWKLMSFRKPLSLIILVNVIAFSLLYFYKNSLDLNTLFAGLTVMGIILVSYVILWWRSLGDEYLFLVVCMLLSLGTIMIFRLDPVLGHKQLIWSVIGMVLFFASYLIYTKVLALYNLTYYYVAASVLLFAVTLAIGKNIHGARNWIVIGSHSFQPSELIKILFIFFLASYYYHFEKLKSVSIPLFGKSITIRREIILMLITFMHLGFLVMQREWGIALLFFLIYFTMMYILASNYLLMLINACIACFGAVTGYLLLYHIKVRVQTWLDPWADVSGKGYQITQSLFAIGSGGFFGTGIGLGNPQYIPEVHTDFIFSAICEEMGIFGGVAVILLFFILVYRGFKIALTVQHPFHKAIALGITLMFGYQTFIIIGGVIKFIPLTGITLPFISYGGSSLTTSFISLGILQAVSTKTGEFKEEIPDEKQ